MPSKNSSSILARLGAQGKKAHEAHRKDETKNSNFGEMPAGVTGIAQLTDCRFGTYNKGANQGQPYFIARGICKSASILPPGVTSQGVVGVPTQIMEPMHETPTRS